MATERNNKGVLPRPKVGVGVMILKGERVLLLLRNGSHGSGEWCCPGGHLELGESFEEAARLEVREETGLEIESAKVISLTNDLEHLDTDDKHYVTVGLLVTKFNGQEEIMEPNKCHGMDWFDLDDLPTSLFAPTAKMIKVYQKNKDKVNGQKFRTNSNIYGRL
ncbi:MAG: NUDIX domain-containing protein [Candidatus Komeilibacteria bacterium]